MTLGQLRRAEKTLVAQLTKKRRPPTGRNRHRDNVARREELESDLAAVRLEQLRHELGTRSTR